MAEPPNYRPAPAVYGQLCRDCEFYEKRRCKMYEVTVGYHHWCSSWKRRVERLFWID